MGLFLHLHLISNVKVSPKDYYNVQESIYSRAVYVNCGEKLRNNKIYD